MNIHVRFPLGIALSVLAATAAQARGPLPQPWLIYPAKTMESCRTGTATTRISVRCVELLGAYAHELEACDPMRRGGPVTAEDLVALQKSNPRCAADAAKSAATRVK